MSVKLLSEYHLEFLRLNAGCRGLSESTLVKIPHCWKPHALAHFVLYKMLSSSIRLIWAYFIPDTSLLKEW